MNVTHRRFTAHVGERGRFVVPAEVRRQMDLDPGDLLVIDVQEDAFVVRKATDVAHGFRGYLRDAGPDLELAQDLLDDRRAEVEREEGKTPIRGGAGAETGS